MYRTSAVFFAALTLAGCSSDSALSDIEEVYVSPVLTVDGPSAGDFLPATSSVVHGTAIGLTDVLVNDIPASVDGDEYQSSIGLERGINRVEVSGTDGRGDTVYARHSVLAGTFADPSKTLDEGLHLRLNKGGLDATCGILSEAIDPTEISDSVAGTPVYEDEYGLFGWNAVEISAVLMSLSFDKLDADLEPSNNNLHLTLEIPDLDTWLNASGEVIGFDFDVDAFVWADMVTVEGDISIYAKQGELEVDFTQPSIVMNGFGYDTSLIPTEVESLVFVDEVREYLEDMLVEKMEEMVPAIIDEQLAGLDLSFETEILEQELKLVAEFAEAEIDNDGIALAVDVNIDLGDDELHEAPGYLSAPSTSPDLSTKSDLALGLSDDVFNRVLYGAWQAGVLDVSMTTEDGSLSETVGVMLKSEQASVVVNPTLPPVMVQRDGALTLQVGEINVVIETPGGEFGDHLEVAVSGSIPVDLVGEESEIRIDLGDPDLSFMVRDSDWGAASHESITNMLTVMLNPTIIMAAVGEIAFPIPTLTDSVDVKSIKVDVDEESYNTGIRINLQ